MGQAAEASPAVASPETTYLRNLASYDAEEVRGYRQLPHTDTICMIAGTRG